MADQANGMANHVNGMANSMTNGTLYNMADDILDTMLNGTVDGTVNGTINGTVNGTMNGNAGNPPYLHLKMSNNFIPLQREIFLIIQSVLLPQPLGSLETVALELDLFYQEISPQDLVFLSHAQFISAFWETFHCIAKQIPYDHPAMDTLVQLIIKVGELPGRRVRVEIFGDCHMWNDLPLLADTYNFSYNVESPFSIICFIT